MDCSSWFKVGRSQSSLDDTWIINFCENFKLHGISDIFLKSAVKQIPNLKRCWKSFCIKKAFEATMYSDFNAIQSRIYYKKVSMLWKVHFCWISLKITSKYNQNQIDCCIYIALNWKILNKIKIECLFRHQFFHSDA